MYVCMYVCMYVYVYVYIVIDIYVTPAVAHDMHRAHPFTPFTLMTKYKKSNINSQPIVVK